MIDKKDAADARRDPLTLIVTSDRHDFVIYTLDRAEIDWEGKRPEAVLIADLITFQLVCFIELKATMKGDPEVYLRRGRDGQAPRRRRATATRADVVDAIQAAPPPDAGAKRGPMFSGAGALRGSTP